MSRKVKDLTGQRFGRWLILERAVKRGKGTRYICRCDCGTVRTLYGDGLKSGNSKSCGCLRDELLIKRATHNMSKTRIYNIWAGMKSRCSNQKDPNYKNYGGRGISVCPEWKESFVTFYTWTIHSGYKEGLQIDRIDNNGNYEPPNGHWVTAKENSRNTRNSIILELKGERKSLPEWADDLNINPGTLYSRIKSNRWTTPMALTTPSRKYLKCGEK